MKRHLYYHEKFITVSYDVIAENPKLWPSSLVSESSTIMKRLNPIPFVILSCWSNS